MRRTRAVFLTALVVLSVLAVGFVAMPAAANEHVLVVDQSDENAYDSIQTAVNDSDPGDTVLVSDGDYTPSSEIVVAVQDLTIEANSSTRPTVRADNLGTGDELFKVRASGVTVRELNIRDDTSQNGVTWDIRTTADGLTVENVSIERTGGNANGYGNPAVVVKNSDGAVVRNSEFTNGAIGASIPSDGSLTIVGNSFEMPADLPNPIWVTGTGFDPLSGNEALTIEDNGQMAVVPTTESGYFRAFSTVTDAFDAPSTDDPVAEGGTVELTSGTYEEDVVVDRPVTLTAADAATPAIVGQGDSKGAVFIPSASSNGGTTVSDVTISGLTIEQGDSGQALNVETGGSDDAPNANIVVEKSELVASDGGFALLAGNIEDSLFENNTFTVADEAAATEIAFVGGQRSYGTASTNVSFVDNTFSGAAARDGQPAGALEHEADDSNITGNDFTGVASDAGVLAQAFGEGVTMEDNDGASVAGDSVLATSIQPAATNAQPGDELLISPGTYEENVTVDTEGVSLRGEGSETVLAGTLKLGAPGDSVSNLQVAPEQTFTPDDQTAAGILVTASSTTIENVTVNGVEGDAAASDDGSITVHGIQVFGGQDEEPIGGIRLANNTVTDVANAGSSGWPNHGGAAAIKIQGNVHDTEVIRNDIENIDSAGWAYGVVTTPSSNAEVSVDDVRVLGNEIEDVSADEYPGVAVGLDTLSGDVGGDVPTEADEVKISYNAFEGVDIGVLNKDTDRTANAPLNWWGADDGPSGEGYGSGVAVEGDVFYNVFLTSPDAIGTPPDDLQRFGIELTMDGGDRYGFASPAPTEKTLRETFNDFNGSIYTFDDESKEWVLVTGDSPAADEELGALDAVLVIPEEGETAAAAVEFANGDAPPAPDANSVETGWNFVGPSQYDGAEKAYGAGTAEPSRLLNLFEGPNGQLAQELPLGGEERGPGQTLDDYTVYDFGEQEREEPIVSAFEGHFVYVDDGDEFAANGYEGVTLSEADDAGLIDFPQKTDWRRFFPPIPLR